MKAKALRTNIASLMSKILGRPRRFEAADGRTADLSEFQGWLIEARETDHLTSSHLRNLFLEFCEFRDADPLTDARFFRGLRAAGIVRFREGGGERRWLYKVKFPELREVESDAA